MIRKIINAMIYDGSGQKPFLGGVTIAKDENGIGRITSVFRGPSRIGNPSICAGDASCDTGEIEIIDAQGKMLTPGFIDIHRHHDLAALYDPDFGTIEIAQGITTAVMGNCGLGAFPNAPATRLAQFDYIEPCLGPVPKTCAISGFPEYLDALSKTPKPINVAALTGVGATATAVMGYEPRSFTAEERSRAAQLVSDAMKAGAVGLSFGIMYLPESSLSREDFVAMARECGKAGGLMTTHIRGEGDSLVESVQEVIDIAREANVRLNISHFKSTGVHNWNKAILEAIALIEKARGEGQVVTVDAYPYTGGATTALSLIPPSVIEGKPLSFLATPEGIQKLTEEIYVKQDGWDNMVESIGFDRVVIGSVTLEKNRIYCGKSVAEAAKEQGFEEPCDWFGPFIAEEEGKVGMILMSMSQEDVDRVLQLPYAALISDSLYGGGDNPHPRLYGAFPKFIREYVNERHILSMEAAIQKMTSMPAERIGLKDRGLIRQGFVADLNVFDPATIRDNATFTDSKQLSSGIAYTLLGGEVAAKDSCRQTESFGHLLRHQPA